MEALHLRAEHNTIKVIMNTINKLSKSGQDIEILDNFVYNQEQQMILTALLEEQKNKTFKHDEIWDNLLE